MKSEGTFAAFMSYGSRGETYKRPTLIKTGKIRKGADKRRKEEKGKEEGCWRSSKVAAVGDQVSECGSADAEAAGSSLREVTEGLTCTLLSAPNPNPHPPSPHFKGKLSLCSAHASAKCRAS